MTEDSKKYKLDDLKITIDYDEDKNPGAGLHALNCIIQCAKKKQQEPDNNNMREDCANISDKIDKIFK